MSSVLIIKPLGPARLASLPILGLEVLGAQKVLGIPLPSTVLGLMGHLLNIRLKQDQVEKDPLLGIGALIDRISARNEKYNSVIQGPVICVSLHAGSFNDSSESVCKTVREQVFTVPIFTKEGVKLVRWDAVKDLGRVSDEEALIIPEDAVIGWAVSRTEVGVALRDSIMRSWSRVVMPGYTFRKSFVQYVNRHGRSLEVEFVYKLTVESSLQKTIARLGGEGRQAIVEVKNLSREREVTEIIRRITSPLEARPGDYLVLNYWPLIPRNKNTLYLERDRIIGLEFFDNPSEDIIGIPRIANSTGSPTIYIVRLGLGFSEVVKQRRSQILALPPGTLIKVKHPFSEVRNQIVKAYVELLRAGYGSLLRI